MKNLIRKQSEEGGDGVRAAEEEEQTHEHEDEASSLAGGELLFLSCFFFCLCSFLFSLASCLCVGCLIHLALYLNAAVGLLDEEEDDEHTDYHNGGAEQENVGEGVELVELRRLRGDSRGCAVDSGDDSAGEQAERAADAAHEVDDGVAFGADVTGGQVGHERDDGSSPKRHDEDEENDEEHRQRKRTDFYRDYRDYRKEDSRDRRAEDNIRTALAETGMGVIGKLTEGRLEDDAENIIKRHDDTDEQRDKRYAACGGCNILAVCRGELGESRERGVELCRPRGYRGAVIEQVVEYLGYVGIVDCPCDRRRKETESREYRVRIVQLAVGLSTEILLRFFHVWL